MKRIGQRCLKASAFFLAMTHSLNPNFTVAIYCGLKILATTLVSRFYSSTYLSICLRRKIAPTARFATVFCASILYLLQNLGLMVLPAPAGDGGL